MVDYFALVNNLREGEKITRSVYIKLKKENPEADEQEILFHTLKSRYYVDIALNDKDILKLIKELPDINSVVNFILLHDYYEQTLFFFPKFRLINRTKKSLEELRIMNMGIWEYIETVLI